MADEAAPRALIGWRLLAMLYDLLPVVALWFATAAPFVLLDAAISGDVRHNIGPFSAVQWLLWATCWGVTGLYATLSWHRGGQTLGMRPWRLYVTDCDGDPAPRHCLWMRYALGTLSVLLAGAGFWWAWFDRDRLTLHDRFSGTRMARRPNRVP